MTKMAMRKPIPAALAALSPPVFAPSALSQVQTTQHATTSPPDCDALIGQPTSGWAKYTRGLTRHR